MVCLSAINPTAQAIHPTIAPQAGLDGLAQPEWGMECDYPGELPPPQLPPHLPPPVSRNNLVIGSVQLGYRADLRRQPKIGEIRNNLVI